jgi:hypothetical protein
MHVSPTHTGSDAARGARRRAGRTAAAATLAALGLTTVFAGSALAAPPTPTGLAAPSPTKAAPALRWATARGAVAYRVYRNGALVRQVSARTFLDAGVGTSGAFRYAVRAVGRRGGLSRPTPVVTVVVDRIAPSAVTGLTAARDANGAPTLEWTPAQDTGGAGRVAYEIERDGATVARVTGTTYVDETAPAGAAVAYRVRAADGVGNAGTFSPVAELAAPAPESAPYRAIDAYTGVSARLTGSSTLAFDDRFPQMKIHSLMLNWRDIQPQPGVFDWGALDASLADAHGDGYRVIVRISCGNDAPAWVYANGVTKLDLIQADRRKRAIEVPLPWDPELAGFYRDMIRGLQAHLAEDGDGSQTWKRGDVVYGVPIALPTEWGTEMVIGYGSGTFSGTYKGVTQTWPVRETNRAEWMRHAADGDTDAARLEANRAAVRQAWLDAVEIHMEELTAAPSMLALGHIFADGYAGADAIVRQLDTRYADRIYMMTTNLQPRIVGDTLRPWAEWNPGAATALRTANALGYPIGFQTAAEVILDTPAKFQYAMDDGVDGWRMRFMETSPGLVQRHASMLLTDPVSVQTLLATLFGG